MCVPRTDPIVADDPLFFFSDPTDADRNYNYSGNDVLSEAIRYGGSSIDDYLQVSGKQGGFVPHLKVYGRAGKPCLALIQEIWPVNSPRSACAVKHFK